MRRLFFNGMRNGPTCEGKGGTEYTSANVPTCEGKVHSPYSAQYLPHSRSSKGTEYTSANVRQRGVSLIEVIAVVLIMGLIFTWGLGIGLNLYRRVTLNGERDGLVMVLRSARTRALENRNQSDHGVYVATTTFVLFQGPSYASRTTTYDEWFPRTTGVAVNGVTSTVFLSLSGNGTASGTITFSNGYQSSTLVSLNYEGRINW